MIVGYEIIDVTGFGKKLTNFKHWLSHDIQNLTKREANRGAKILVSMMPHQTGAMQRAVSVSPDRNAWAIVSKTPRGQTGKSRPYHIFYNHGKRGWYKGGIKSGEFHYYEKTVRALGNHYPQAINQELKEIFK